MSKIKIIITVMVILAFLTSFMFIVGFMPSDGSPYKTMSMAVNDVDSIKTALLNSEGKDSGKAFVLRKGGKLYHYVSAALPAPEAGKFYEGWLLNAAGDKMSTGDLVADSAGNYELSYMSSMVLDGYDKVVITLETTKDDMPEVPLIIGVAQYTPGSKINVDGTDYFLAGAPAGTIGGTDIPGHAWVLTSNTELKGVHFNTGPGGMASWWSSDAADGALLYVVNAKIDTWSAEKATMYKAMGYVHYHELVSVADGSMHPDKVVWLKHIAVTSFTLDGGPAPDFSHSVVPGVDSGFVPNGAMPYSP